MTEITTETVQTREDIWDDQAVEMMMAEMVATDAGAEKERDRETEQSRERKTEKGREIQAEIGRDSEGQLKSAGPSGATRLWESVSACCSFSECNTW